MRSIAVVLFYQSLLLTLLWLSVSPLSWPRFFKKEVKDNQTKVEDDFVELYGDFVGSGVWEPLIDMYNDTERLQRICKQAHEKTHREPTGEVRIFRCDQKNMTFNNPKHRSFDMEVIVYGIEGFNRADGKPHYFYVGKGMTPDCLFYLNATDVRETTFRLADHVCGIEI